MKAVLSFLFLIVCLSGSFAQDSLVLSKGGVLHGEIVHKNRRQVMLETNGRVIIVPHSDILSLNYGNQTLAGRRWALGLVPGISFGGVGKRTRKLLNENGFADSPPSNSESQSPSTADPVLFLETTYLVDLQWRLGLQAGFSNSGRISGYRSSPTDLTLTIRYDHFSLTPFVRWTSARQYIHLMAGPSLGVLDYYRSKGENYPDPSVSNPQLKLGFMLGAGVSLLERARHYLHLQGQYFVSSSISIGPYANTSVGPLPVVDVLLPAQKMPFHHLALSLAYGWKIRGR